VLFPDRADRYFEAPIPVPKAAATTTNTAPASEPPV